MGIELKEVRADDASSLVWRGLAVKDGKEWVARAIVERGASEERIKNAVAAKFAEGACWLNNPKDVAKLPDKVSLTVNVFTYSRQIGGEVFIYTHSLKESLKDHPKLAKVDVTYTVGYPTDLVRNAVAKEAKGSGYDYLLMLDDDMSPDVGVASRFHHDPDAVPFLPSALEFAMAHDGPCCVGAPYTAGPPNQEVLVMKQREKYPDMPTPCGLMIDKYTRDEAAIQKGIQRVAALPTGVLLIDLRIMDILPPPWFSYEYGDEPHNTRMGSTEDVVFSRNCDWLDIPQYCAWDSWAGHCKVYTTGKPLLAPLKKIPQSVYKAWDTNNWRPSEQLSPV